MRRLHIQHEFVEFIPERLEQGKLYISIPYATATHLCCCGCGFEVSNPITPTDWTLSFDGESVSLTPSIGNSSFPCQSHYWIDQNRVCWESRMTRGLTDASRRRDVLAKNRKYGSSATAEPTTEKKQKLSLVERIRKKIFK